MSARLLPPLLAPTIPTPPRADPRRGVFVDWYQFRCRLPVDALRVAISDAFSADGLSCPIEWHREAGRGGFAHWDIFTMGGMRLGHIAWGGRNVAGWSHVVMSGQGCSMPGDFDSFDESLRTACPGLEYRRVDLAVDVLDGAVSFELCEEAWECGGFDPVRGARPKRDRKGYPEGGRTFYVGSRGTSDRFIRMYEKGLEANYHPWGEGVDLRAWFRLEVELKPANAPIPLDVVKQREAFFVGAAPFLRHVWGRGLGRRSARDPLSDIAAEVAEAVRHLRRSAGPALRVLVEVYGGSEALVQALTSGVQPSDRLVQAGASIINRQDLAKFGV